MSMEAVLIATVTHLREALRLKNSECDIQPGGRPPASCGEFYVAVDEGRVENSEKVFLNEAFAIQVYISRRSSVQPKDRKGSLYTSRLWGLGLLERRVIVALHNSQAVRALANAELGAPQENMGDAILQPLYYLGRGSTRSEGGDWCGAEPDKDAFLVRVLNFQGGLRIQALDVAK